MSTQFFERQDAQRSYTRWLVFGFIAAIVAVVAIIDVIVLVGVELNPSRTLRQHPEIVIWVSVAVSLTILIASWHRASQLRQGGGVVAKAAGGVHVLPNDPDFARQRLLNVVEEMAIAARVRKPMVFVLPGEPGINAFAAGNSPDEAAIAVTQGAIERLDREQLQAVVGHEFSHILNGDMKINMRLTAFIFGLFVVTDLALRLMNHRGRGKRDGRLFLVALGIFAAGSIGLLAGRLLQAAVSRRREHLADASSVQFTRNPQALQGAFIAMSAHPAGTRLVNTTGTNVAHMLIAGSDPSWADNLGGSWFATHPSLQERVQALDARVSPIKFRTLVSDEKRRFAARQSPPDGATSLPPGADAAPATALTPVAAAAPIAGAIPIAAVTPPAAAAPNSTPAIPAAAAAGAPVPPVVDAPETDPVLSDAASLRLMATAELDTRQLQETLPSGVRMVGGRALPPDDLRNRLGPELLESIAALVSEVEGSPIALQGTLVAAMLATEPAKWRTQLVKLAPLLGIELMKATQAQVARFAQLAPAARLPAITDLLTLLDQLDPAERKRLRAVVRGFAPTVATGDLFRYAVTRVLEKKLAKAGIESQTVQLPERAADVCVLFAALAQGRAGPGSQGMNAYRAGVMGMMPAKMWAPYPDDLVAIAALDASLAALRHVDPTGRRALSDGMARVLAVGGMLTVPQVDLLRAACLLIDCPLPSLPVDLVFGAALANAHAQASAR